MPTAASSQSPLHLHLLRLTALRFFWILVLLVLFIAFVGENPRLPNGRIDGAVVFLILITAIMFAARVAPSRMVVALCLNCIPFGIWLWFVHRQSPTAEFLCFLAVLLCVLYAIYCTLEFVLLAGAVSAEHIIGGICAYIMIAMFFATIYTLLFLDNPAAFAGVPPHDAYPWSDLLYFSFCTVSTVGYGDITPVLPLARSFSMLEQLTGTFYLAILIARLTGFYPPRGQRNGASPPQSPEQE